jgi:holo-[acyl-carrier protein] synthase
MTPREKFLLKYSVWFDSMTVKWYNHPVMIKGIGIDSIEIARIDRIRREYGDRFLSRVFTSAEQAYVSRFHAPQVPLAARFAAKEACLKALGTGLIPGVRWQDIEVVNNEAGKPALVLHGGAEKKLRQLQAGTVHLSLTHSKEMATAVVILE